MGNKKHALLSPSGAHRWLVCTPSARLEQIEVETYGEITSEYAKEGTEAHTLSEIKLSFMLGKISADLYDTKFENFMLHSEFYTPEFNEYVNDYCNEVMNIITMDYLEDEIVDVHLEEKVEFTDLVPKGSGTCDVIIVGHRFIHTIDLKFGRGVPVSAIDNPQLRLYTLGALRKYGIDKNLVEARMTIIQPRLYDISTENMLSADLEQWGLEYVKPRALLAYNGEGELVPGEHCKFCKIRGKCKALGNLQLEEAKKEFESNMVSVEDSPPRILRPNEMTPEAISNVLQIAPLFIDWFKSVSSYATAAMINGDLKVPGYKVVEGRAYRKIIDDEAVKQVLKEAGFEDKVYLSEPELLGITALEKNVGKRLFNDLCGELIDKPDGKPTIAKESDKRPEIGTSQFRLSGQEFDEDY